MTKIEEFSIVILVPDNDESEIVYSMEEAHVRVLQMIGEGYDASSIYVLSGKPDTVKVTVEILKGGV